MTLLLLCRSASGPLGRCAWVCAMLGLMCGLPCRAAAQNRQRDWMLGPFEKPKAGNPVITPTAASTFRSPIGNERVRWEATATFNPAAVVRNGTVHVLYRAEDDGGDAKIGGHTSRLGMARSADGVHFTRSPRPVFYPDSDAQAKNEWPGGVEDPRIIETDDGRYVMTYTQWNRSIPRLAVATSRDLVTWTKHGPAFARAADAKYLSTESKSGAILGRMMGDRIVATKVRGKYWMYFSVPQIHIATSDNLIDWTPLETSDGMPRVVLAPRSGYFDSWLVEPGPPALLTERGIILLYNAGNSEHGGDPSLPARVYTAGQALFDADDPTKLLDRADRPFLRPTESYERTGQYPEGTTFVEGLVSFRGRWFLYYGSADSRVGVAVSGAGLRQSSGRARADTDNGSNNFLLRRRDCEDDAPEGVSMKGAAVPRRSAPCQRLSASLSSVAASKLIEEPWPFECRTPAADRVSKTPGESWPTAIPAGRPAPLAFD